MVNFVGVERGSLAFHVRWLVILAGLWFGGAHACAQDEDPPEPKPATETPAPPDILKDGTLDVTARVYILDSRNRPVFVPTTYEQYIDKASAAARRAEGGDAPLFKFDELSVDATVQGKVAEVHTEVKITLNELARKVTDIPIPLRLQSCLLTRPIEFKGEGKSLPQVGRDHPGYTWWLQAEPNTQHSATLVGQTAVQVEGDRQLIQFALPATVSTVQVTLPANIQDIKVRGQGGEVTSDEPMENGRRVMIKSLGGDIQVSWRNSNDAKPTVAAAEATSITRLRVDDDPREPWLAETVIKLRSHDESPKSPIETLTVELPEGSEWLPIENQSGEQYDLVLDANNPRKATVRAATRGNLALVPNLRMEYRWKPPVSADETNWNNLAVPSVTIRGVDRHEGSLTMVVPASLGLNWKSPPGVALRSQAPGEIRDSVQYDFHFVRQPLGLTVSFRREMNLAEVRPTYLVEVDRSGIKLTGWLKCAFYRAHEPELGIDLGDWELDSAQVIADMSNPMAEGELLNQQTVATKSGNILKLRSQLDPELAGVTQREQQIWRITAFRNHAQKNVDRLSMNLPTLMAPDQTGVPLENASGLLLVAASENVLLDFDAQSSPLLLSDSMAAPWQTMLKQLQLSTDRVLSYRFQSGTEDKPRWTGRLEILPRRVAAEQSIQLKLDTETAMVHQRFQLQIANEALSQLQLAPNGAQNISVLVDNIPWVLEPAPTNSAGDSSTEPKKEAATLIAKGGRKLLGKVIVEVHSQQTLPKIPAFHAAHGDSRWDTDAVSVSVPLVGLAVDDVLVRSPVAVLPTIDRRLQVSLGNGETLPEVDDPDETTASKVNWSVLDEDGFEIPAAQPAIPLKMVLTDSADSVPVRVAGAWIQTVVSGSTRADRFCARFKTAQDSLQLRLPANDLLAQVAIAIDGVEQVFNAPREGNVQISVRDVSHAEEHTLEVWTRSTTTAGWINKIDVTPIEIEGCSRFDHFYWQLVTSPNMHLALLPENLTPEWTWVWNRLWWQRSSPTQQADLEQWLSASSQRPLAQASNKYVVSSYGAIAGFQVWTVSRLLLWLPIGLISIGGALLVSLFRSFRHPAALLLLIACVLSTATIWPDLAILLGQTALVALAIVLLYALTQAAVESRVRRRSVFTSRPTSGAYDPSDNHTLIRPLSVGENEMMPTTRTQSPVVADGGGVGVGGGGS